MISQFFPSYTIGADAYDAIPGVCGAFGKTAVIIGGQKSRAAAEPAIRAACEGKIDILGSYQYGTNCTFEAVDALMAIPEVAKADMIFGVGGGRAVDTAKVTAEKLGKPVFTFPTLCSNCAPVTAVCVVYYPNGAHRAEWYRKGPANHTFINTDVVLHSPRDYFWAGIGDALSKQYEVLFSLRGDENVPYVRALGAQIAANCSDELYLCGVEAMEDFDKKECTETFEKAVQIVILTTGIVSCCLTEDYNTSVGHAIYYAHTGIPHEGTYLHGAVVCYGLLLLLTLDGQLEERDKLYAFCRALKLPYRLADIGETKETAKHLAEAASLTEDVVKSPYVITKDMIYQAMLDVEALSEKEG